MKVLHTLDKILGKISNACAWVSGAALFLMAALIFINVIGRYFFQHAITGADELVQFLMVLVVYFALSYSTRIRAHVRVDFVTNMMPEYIRLIVLGIVTLACIFVSVNISIRTFAYAGTVIASNTRSPILKISYAPFYYAISVLNILLSFEFLADGLKYFGEAARAFKNRHKKVEQATAANGEEDNIV